MIPALYTEISAARRLKCVLTFVPCGRFYLNALYVCIDAGAVVHSMTELGPVSTQLFNTQRKYDIFWNRELSP